MADPQPDLQDVFAGLVRAMPALAIVLRGDGEFVEIIANDRTRDLLYDDPSELVGRTVFDVFPVPLAEEFDMVVRDVLRTDSVQQYEYQLPVGGETKFFTGYVAPVPTDEDEADHVMWIAEDVTERKRLERERRRQYDHLVRTEELADMGGWEYYPDTGRLRWTDGARQVFDAPDEYEVTVEEGFELYHREDRPTIREAFEKCLQSGVQYSVTSRVVTMSGRQRWVQTTGERVSVNGRPKLVGVVQDVTDRVTNEQQLMVLNRVLRHNLRNELSVITGYLELLSDELGAAMQPYLRKISSSSEDLLSLAEKSRRFSEALDYDDTTGPVRLERVFDDICASYRDRYPDATIEYEPTTVEVPANEVGLRILFEELLDNALRYNERAEPTVLVTSEETSHGRTSVEVADDGPGLSEMERDVLQRGQETDLIHSNGIGLWLVNWLTTRFRGDVSVRDDASPGATIVVTLPTASTAATWHGDDVTTGRPDQQTDLRGGLR
jgi:PAS domain S-box-containing protein